MAVAEDVQAHGQSVVASDSSADATIEVDPELQQAILKAGVPS